MKKIITLIALAIFGFSFSQTTVIYQNYRNSIVSVNWNALGVELSLTPSQRNAITVLNNRYPTYESWYVVYKDRPGYWERDRDRELRRILGLHLMLNIKINIIREIIQMLSIIEIKETMGIMETKNTTDIKNSEKNHKKY